MIFEAIDKRQLQTKLTHEHFKKNGFEKGSDFVGECFYVNDQTENVFVVYYCENQFFIYNTTMEKIEIKTLGKMISLFEAFTETKYVL